MSEVEASEKMDEGEEARQDDGQGKNDNQSPRGERPGSDTTVRRDGSESPRGEKTKYMPGLCPNIELPVTLAKSD